MKILCSGFILFCFSFSALAGTTVASSRSSTLLLRGRVPASTNIEWEKGDKNSVPVIKTNGSKYKPHFVLKDKKNHRQITIIHP